MRFIMILLSLSLSALFISAQFSVDKTILQADPTPEASSTYVPTDVPSTSTSHLDEAGLLRAQLETMQRYDQKLIQTVYWSLGGIASLAVLIAGFSWFTNFRLYQRDKDSLRDELRVRLDTSLAEIKAENQSSLRQIHTGLGEIIDDRIGSKTSELEQKIDLIRTDSRRLHFVQDFLEARIWEIDEVMPNALRYYTNALSGFIELGETGTYSSLLTSIITVLTELSEVTSWDSSSLNRVLESLPSDYTTEVAKINELLIKKLRA